MRTGQLGEDIAVRFLLGKGYEILGRNYRKHHGEIDIVAKDLKEIVFVEVKTVTREIPGVTSRTVIHQNPHFALVDQGLNTIRAVARVFSIKTAMVLPATTKPIANHVSTATSVTRETYRPEYNIDPRKIEVVSRTAELYLLEKSLNIDWRIDVVAVELNKGGKTAHIRHLKSVHV